MPKQISKNLSVQLYDEEVVAWNSLQDYALKMNLVIASRPDSSTVSSPRVLREILRLAAEGVAADIGPEVAASLAAPRPYPLMGRGDFPSRKSPTQSASRASKKKPAKSAGRRPKSVKKPAVKSNVRVFWDRRWNPPLGDT